MEENNLPKEYKGYSTEKLLGHLRTLHSHQALKDVPSAEIEAMDDLDREYRLSPIFNKPK